MSDPSHTPGPWHVIYVEAGEAPGSRAFVVSRAKKNSLGGHLPLGRAEFDRALIAAAPDLLDALEGLLQLAEAGIPALVARSHPEEQSGHEDGYIAMLDAARAAIAAAKGGTL